MADLFGALIICAFMLGLIAIVYAFVFAMIPVAILIILCAGIWIGVTKLIEKLKPTNTETRES